MKKINLKKYPLFVILLHSMLDNIAIEWGENICIETSCEITDDTEIPVVVTKYNKHYTTLYSTGEIYKVTLTDKGILIKDKKLGTLEINFKADFENETIIENIAVQYINFLQEL